MIMERPDVKDYDLQPYSYIADLTKYLEFEVKENSNKTDMYKECFEKFIPVDKWDEASLFLSTYGCGLAKELAKKGI